MHSGCDIGMADKGCTLSQERRQTTNDSGSSARKPDVPRRGSTPGFILTLLLVGVACLGLVAVILVGALGNRVTDLLADRAAPTSAPLPPDIDRSPTAAGPTPSPPASPPPASPPPSQRRTHCSQLSPPVSAVLRRLQVYELQRTPQGTWRFFHDPSILQQLLDEAARRTPKTLLVVGRRDCAPCIHELPMISAFAEENRDHVTTFVLFLDRFEQSDVEREYGAARRVISPTVRVVVANLVEDEGQRLVDDLGSIPALVYIDQAVRDARVCCGATVTGTAEGRALESFGVRTQGLVPRRIGPPRVLPPSPTKTVPLRRDRSAPADEPSEPVDDEPADEPRPAPHGQRPPEPAAAPHDPPTGSQASPDSPSSHAAEPAARGDALRAPTPPSATDRRRGRRDSWESQEGD